MLTSDMTNLFVAFYNLMFLHGSSEKNLLIDASIW